jgi:hypothetical protein
METDTAGYNLKLSVHFLDCESFVRAPFALVEQSDSSAVGVGVDGRGGVGYVTPPRRSDAVGATLRTQEKQAG